jgi:predicted dehydrogenase
MKAVVIGCGRMGARHVEALIGIGVDIIGLYDLNQDNALGIVSKYNLKNEIVFENLTALFESKEIDLCVIATTAPSHKEYIDLALKSGIKKILCEKPLSTSLQNCANIMESAKQHNAHIAVNHQMRYLEQYTLPKRLLKSSEFGGLESININAGNFGMAMNGVHYIEMARFMFDELPYKIAAWFDEKELPNPRGIEFKDKSGSFRFSTPTGKTCYLNAASTNGHGIIVTYCAKYGQIVVDELAGHMYFTHRNVEDLSLPTTRYGQPSIREFKEIKAVDIITSTQLVLKDLINGAGYPTLEDATMAIKTLIAAYISDESKHAEIEIDNMNCNNRNFPWA